MQGVTSSYNAFYKEDKFSKAHWLIRGYTGHEMLPEFGLVNMNGRVYDPLLSRMLSPDKFVHGFAGSQGFNRYSYVLNNTLSYVEPDGNEPITFAIVLAAKGISKIAGKIAVKKVAAGKSAKLAGKVAKVSKKKMYSHSVSGLSNSLNQTEWKEAGSGWEPLGHFAAGFLGSSVGIENKEKVATIFGMVISGGATTFVNEERGDIEDEYDLWQSFVGGALSGMLGKNLYKSAGGYVKQKGWKAYAKSAMKFESESLAGAFAFDEKDEFFQKDITYHLGIFGAGAVNGLIVAGFEGYSQKLTDFGFDDYRKSFIELGIRSAGVSTEFLITSFAKSKYKNIYGKGFGGKFGKGLLKNVGYILTIFY